MSLQKLSAGNVRSIFLDCTAIEIGGNKADRIEIVGIVQRAHFIPNKLQYYNTIINTLLSQLPFDFGQKCGGASFPKMLQNNRGQVWANSLEAEMLFMLGLATDNIILKTPRKDWNKIGGLPTFVLNNSDKMAMAE